MDYRGHWISYMLIIKYSKRSHWRILFPCSVKNVSINVSSENEKKKLILESYNKRFK